MALSAAACGSEFSGDDSASTGGSAGDGGTGSASSGGNAGTAGNSGGSPSTGDDAGNAAGGVQTGGTGATSNGGSDAGSGGTAGGGGMPCSVELLRNGHFDDGRVVWLESTTDGTPILYHRANTLLIEQGVTSHSPDFLAWLGGPPDQESILSQEIVIPDGAQFIRVAGFHRITTDESPEVYDQAYVELVQGDTALALGYWSNVDEFNEWTAFEEQIAANALAPGPVTFQVRSVLDSGVDTEFFFDSLSLTAEFCVP